MSNEIRESYVCPKCGCGRCGPKGFTPAEKEHCQGFPMELDGHCSCCECQECGVKDEQRTI